MYVSPGLLCTGSSLWETGEGHCPPPSPSMEAQGATYYVLARTLESVIHRNAPTDMTVLLDFLAGPSCSFPLPSKPRNSLSDPSPLSTVSTTALGCETKSGYDSCSACLSARWQSLTCGLRLKRSTGQLSASPSRQALASVPHHARTSNKLYYVSLALSNQQPHDTHADNQ